MTAETAIMNTQGIALATDSSVTFGSGKTYTVLPLVKYQPTIQRRGVSCLDCCRPAARYAPRNDGCRAKRLTIRIRGHSAFA
jgi:hypothetical protein